MTRYEPLGSMVESPDGAWVRFEDAPLDDVRVLLKAFDDGVFVRNVGGDREPGWAIRLLPVLAALGRLARAAELPPAPTPPRGETP